MSQYTIIDATWILRLDSTVCVVWCGTGHPELTSRQHTKFTTGTADYVKPSPSVEHPPAIRQPRWPSGKASTWRAGDTRINPRFPRLSHDSGLRVDTVVEIKLAFKLVKTTGHCSTVHGKFLIVLYFLVITTSADTLASTRTLNL